MNPLGLAYYPRLFPNDTGLECPMAAQAVTEDAEGYTATLGQPCGGPVMTGPYPEGRGDFVQGRCAACGAWFTVMRGEPGELVLS